MKMRKGKVTRLLAVLLSLCLTIGLFPVSAFADTSPGQTETQNDNNQYKVTLACKNNFDKAEVYYHNEAEFVKVDVNNKQVTLDSGVNNIKVKIVPITDYEISYAKLVCNGQNKFSVPNEDISALMSKSGYVFSLNAASDPPADIALEYEIQPKSGGGNNQGNIKVNFPENSVSENTVKYTVNGTQVTVTVDGATITDNAVFVPRGDDLGSVTFTLDGFNDETMIVKAVASDGFTATLSVTDNKTSLATWNGGLPDNLTLYVEPKRNDNPPPESGPEDPPVHGGYEDGADKTATVKINGSADFYINDSRMVNSENVHDKTEEVKYKYKGNGYVDFYICSFINMRYTEFSVNGVDYISALPKPEDTDFTEKMLEACKGQINEFKITVPYNESGYTITAEQKSLDNDDAAYMIMGNFLWSYTDNNVVDDYIDNGVMRLMDVEYKGRHYSQQDINDKLGFTVGDKTFPMGEGTIFDWRQDNNGGGAVLPVGAVVTVKLVPNYGYQLTSFGINGGRFGTGDEQSVFTFEIKPGNAHLGAKFTKVNNVTEVDTGTLGKINSASIDLGDNTVDSGTLVFDVKEVTESGPSVAMLSQNESESSSFNEELVANGITDENLEYMQMMDINLNQVFYKGKEDMNDVWSNSIKHLNSEATVSLELEELAGDVVVIHEIVEDDGNGGTTTRYKTLQSETNGNTVTFKTDGFSRYLLATKKLDKSFFVDFDSRGDDNARVSYKIGYSDTVPVTSMGKNIYTNGSEKITFTVTPPADRFKDIDGKNIIPVIDTEIISGDGNGEWCHLDENEIMFSSDGTFSFSIVPNQNVKKNNGSEPIEYFEDYSFILHIVWSEFDLLWPDEGKVMITANVPGDKSGNIIVSKETNEKASLTTEFAKSDKYIYSKADENVTLTIKPEDNKKIVGYFIGFDIYGFEDDETIPDEEKSPMVLKDDGSCEIVVNLNDIDWDYYIEAVFDDRAPEPTLTPTPTPTPSNPTSTPKPSATPTPTPAPAVSPRPTQTPEPTPEVTPVPAENAKPEEADTTIIDITVSEEIIDAVKEVVTVEEGTAKVEAEVIEKVIEATEDGKEIVLPIAEATDGFVNNAEISSQALASIAEKNTDVVIRLTDVTVKLDAQAIASVTERAKGKNIEIRAVKTEAASLTVRQQSALSEKETAIIVTVRIFAEDEYIGNFNGGTATVMLPFTPEEGKNAEDYLVYYIDGNGNLEQVASEYKDGYMIFSTGHFSEYAVVYRSEVNEPAQNPAPVTKNHLKAKIIIPIAAVFAVCIFCAVLVIKKRADREE